MAFQRQLGNARVVSLNNLTEWPQLARVTVPGQTGRTPIVLSGSLSEAPEVVSDQYQVELPPYGYMWLLFDDKPQSTTPARN
jgi:maltose alpha-D-glucosyltransferase/alpha-amylase